MSISYNKLWKLMIDNKLKKKFLSETVGLNRTTVSHLNHDEHVSTESLLKICKHLECDFDDIVSCVADNHISEIIAKDQGGIL